MLSPLCFGKDAADSRVEHVPHPFYVLHRVISTSWVPVNDALTFLRPLAEESPTVVSFICSESETGWRHLYLVVVQLAPCSVESREGEKY